MDKLKQLINQYFNIPVNLFTKENQNLAIATFFGAGYFKTAPGTFASFVTILLAIILHFINPALITIATFLAIIIGFWVCNKIVTNPTDDPSYIVIDEVAGQLIAVLMVSYSIPLMLVAFIVFRILDIKKPWIIGQAEKMFTKGNGVMMDDIIAGFLTLLIMVGIKTIFSV